MKHYYLYILAGHEIDTNTKFFRVAIGESAKELKLKAWLESYALEHGHLLALWTNSTAEFYAKCLDSLGYEFQPLLNYCADGMKRYLQTGEEDPATYHANLNRHRLLMQIDSKYYAEHTIHRFNK